MTKETTKDLVNWRLVNLLKTGRPITADIAMLLQYLEHQPNIRFTIGITASTGGFTIGVLVNLSNLV